MRNGTMIGVWAAAVALLIPGTMQAQNSVDPFDWSGEIQTGRTLRIMGISGDVQATFAPGAEAQVHAEKRGRESDFDEVRILIDEDQDGVTICAVYFRSDAEGCSRRGDHDDHDRGRGNRDLRVSVDFQVSLPAGVDLRADMVSGDISAEGLESDIYANTVSGDVDISTSELAEARTVSGRIEADIGSSDLADLEFQTVSGDIRVFLPEAADADVRFSSLSGDFDTDLPFEIRRQRDGFVGSSVRGQLGSGGPELRFSTVSGDVDVRRRRGGQPRE